MKIPYSEIKNLLEIDTLQSELHPSNIKNIFAELGFTVENEEKSSDESNYIYDIDIPANRSDLLSVYEVLKQLAIYLNVKLKSTDLTKKLKIYFINDPNILQIVDTEFAPLYYGIIAKVKVKDSTPEFQQRLKKLGLNPINNVVDATNFVCNYFGQPMHSFDYAKIKDGKVIVRKSKCNEKFTGLDGKERMLKSGYGVIADSEKILAIAGILGANNSDTNFNTEKIFLECASFNRRDVYKASKDLLIETESSYRFKRGVPYSFALRAINAFFNILQHDAVIEKALCFNNIKESKREIAISFDFIYKRIGCKIPATNILSILKRLECKVEQNNDMLVVCPPLWRTDLQIKEDLIEEIARFIGYKNIDGPTTLKISNPVTNFYDKKTEKIKEYLTNNGFFECISTSFMERRMIEKLELASPTTTLNKNSFISVNAIKNPDKFLRNKILFTLMDVYRTNLSIGFEKINLFEIGKVFCENFTEKENLCLVSNHFNAKDLKEFAHNILQLLSTEYEIKNCKNEILQNAFQILHNNLPIGYGGEVKKEILSAYQIKFSKVSCVEFNIDKILSKDIEESFYKDIPNFAPLKIDISFILDKDLEYKDVKNFIHELNITLLSKFELIDVFTDPKIGEDKKSYTIRLYFQHPQHTLQKTEVKEEIEFIFKSLKDKFNITPR